MSTYVIYVFFFSKLLTVRCDVGELITINILPDDVLLEMFDFYVEDGNYDIDIVDEWITLTHVCRRWRAVVFQSPLRLNLRLLCTPITPTRDALDIWPPLPLIIRCDIFGTHAFNNISSVEVDNIIAALEHSDRVCRISLDYLPSSQSNFVTNSAVMQKPFPELTSLFLGDTSDGDGQIQLPESFLGGTAPRLQVLFLDKVSFPGLPKLLLSSTQLVDLELTSFAYIPPDEMATALSALTSLGRFCLQFRCPRPRPARRPPPPPPTRSILPNLTTILFKGASEYLEVILARIDTLRLCSLHIAFFNQIIFDTPQLLQFISRQMLMAPEKGHIEFSSHAIIIEFPPQIDEYGVLRVKILCTAPEWQLSSLEQVCTSSLPHVSTLEDLYIFEDREGSPRWQDDVENTLWLDLLHPFAAVKNLYLYKECAPRIAPALQELVGGRTMQVLPNLENIFIERFQPSGPRHEGIEKFVAARRLASHPVAVSRWDRVSEE